MKLALQPPAFVPFISLWFSNRSRVQRFRGSRFYFRSWTAFETCIYDKSVIFDMPNLKSGAKLAISLKNDHVQPGIWVFAFLPLTLNVEP